MDQKPLSIIEEEVISSLECHLVNKNRKDGNLYINPSYILDKIIQVALVAEDSQCNKEFAAIAMCLLGNWEKVQTYIQAAQKQNSQSLTLKFAIAFNSLHNIELTPFDDIPKTVAAINDCLDANSEFLRRYNKEIDFTQIEASLHLFLLNCLVSATLDVIHDFKTLDQTFQRVVFHHVSTDPQKIAIISSGFYHASNEYKIVAEDMKELLYIKQIIYS